MNSPAGTATIIPMQPSIDGEPGLGEWDAGEVTVLG